VKTYRAADVTKLVGISYRQLDYWARTGLLRPSVQDAGGSGSQRLYSEDDVLNLHIITILLDAGVSLGRIRKDGDPRATVKAVAATLRGAAA
jgi:DNA-binding transcriptional MerR regulator